MNIFKNDITRGIIFLVGCIGTRLSLSIFILYNPYYRLLSLLLFSIGLGFITIYLFGLREKGREVGGGTIWWNTLRPIHGILYIIGSYYLYNNNKKNSSIAIFIDTVIGLISWYNHRIIG
tara:strand:+ start:2687 stop:3046 length:360 start_codon:yes stop_codon:yes gene_type:complete